MLIWVKTSAEPSAMLSERLGRGLTGGGLDRADVAPRYLRGFGPGRLSFRDMAAFLYRCPTTGLRVQGWLADNPAQHGEHYELVSCLACAGRHLVNTSTSKTPRRGGRKRGEK